MNKKTWSNTEVELLINFYPNSTDNELIELLPSRTLVSIKVKAKKLKLKKTNDAKFKNRSLSHTGEKNGMFGKKNPLNGSTYDDFYGIEKSDMIKNKLSEYRNNNPIKLFGEKNGMFGKKPYNYGSHLSQEVKDILSKKAIIRYENLSDEEKEKRRELWINNVLIPLMSNKIKTKPEFVFENMLKELNILYEQQKPIGFYVVDYCVNNIIFEIQGDYWHGNPLFYDTLNLSVTQKKNIARDKAKKTFLENRGYFVYYFWENDLIKNIDECKKEIKNILYEKI